MVEVKTTDVYSGYVMGHAQGVHAIMILTHALWRDKTATAKCEVDYDIDAGTITVTTIQYKYEFTNVPLLGSGDIDLRNVYIDHIRELKEKEVI